MVYSIKTYPFLIEITCEHLQCAIWTKNSEVTVDKNLLLCTRIYFLLKLKKTVMLIGGYICISYSIQ